MKEGPWLKCSLYDDAWGYLVVRQSRNSYLRTFETLTHGYLATTHSFLKSGTNIRMGSVVLPHLTTGWHVDQAILTEEERLVVIRFGRDWDPDCMRQDEVLYSESVCIDSISTADIRTRNSGSGKELRSHICLRSRSSARFQTDVRTLRYSNADVLFPKQTYDVRFWDW